MSSVGVVEANAPRTPLPFAAMGATDVLPYPRRRSSIQLDPLECRVPVDSTVNSSPLSTSPLYKSRNTSVGTEDELLPGHVVDMAQPPSLNPVKNLVPRRYTNAGLDEQRCHSCEHPQHRGRSQSLHPQRNKRPGEGGRRRHGSEDNDNDDDDESTAKFIEKLRRELLAQM